jgi:MFS superfamily sulfate permease-like transporter
MNDSRQLPENHDGQSLQLSTLSSANSFTSSIKHRNLTNIHELVDRPIDQWDLQDWIFLLIVLFIISMIFRIFSRIGCCGCSLMDCLTCWFCWELFCDPSPGMDYGLC